MVDGLLFVRRTRVFRTDGDHHHHRSELVGVCTSSTTTVHIYIVAHHPPATHVLTHTLLGMFILACRIRNQRRKSRGAEIKVNWLSIINLFNRASRRVGAGALVDVV